MWRCAYLLKVYNCSIPAALTVGTALPPRGGRCILSVINVVSASRSMAHLIGGSRVFIYIFHEPPRGGAKSYAKNYRAKQVRYAASLC
jgi:hypothetical protein